MSFTTASLAEARSYAERARAKMREFRSENSKKITAGVAAVETTGTAYAFGFGTGAMASCAYRYGHRLGESMAITAGAKVGSSSLGGAPPAPQLGGAPRVFATPNGQQYTVVQHP